MADLILWNIFLFVSCDSSMGVMILWFCTSHFEKEEEEEEEEEEEDSNYILIF